jgi:hypothetical protein
MRHSLLTRLPTRSHRASGYQDHVGDRHWVFDGRPHSGCVLMPYKNKVDAKINKRTRYLENQEQRVIKQRTYYLDIRKYLLTNAKQRAIKLADIVVPNKCPLLDIPIVRGVAKLHDNSPTLDRIRNDLGYVPGNTVVISYAANRAKGNLTSADLLKLATRLAAMEVFGAPTRRS